MDLRMILKWAGGLVRLTSYGTLTTTVWGPNDVAFTPRRSQVRILPGPLSLFLAKKNRGEKEAFIDCFAVSNFIYP